MIQDIQNELFMESETPCECKSCAGNCSPDQRELFKKQINILEEMVNKIIEENNITYI